MTYRIKKVDNPHNIIASVPGSKSITNRALLIAALSSGRCSLKGVLFSDDSRHFLDALMSLGFSVDVDEKNANVTIQGTGGKIPNKEATVDVGSAGTAARFLTAFLGLSEGRYRMVSSEQMKKRPMKELLVALEELGACIEYEEEEYHFPFVIYNKGINCNQVTVDVDKSSQFLSALLISSVILDKNLTINITGSHGMAYVDMTVRMMEQFGVCITKNTSPISFQIEAGSSYKAIDYDIEPDLSAACYFYAMSPVLKVKSQVLGVKREGCLQGDVAFLDVLSQMGCECIDDEAGIIVKPPNDGIIKGGSFDLSAFSDQALTLSAIAPFASDMVKIRGISHIRYQECDRINAICHNLKALGIDVKENEDGVDIIPGNVTGAVMETYEDHRVAMSFSIPGLVIEGVEIENPYCCRKTFENYFEVLEGAVY